MDASVARVIADILAKSGGAAGPDAVMPAGVLAPATPKQPTQPAFPPPAHCLEKRPFWYVANPVCPGPAASSAQPPQPQQPFHITVNVHTDQPKTKAEPKEPKEPKTKVTEPTHKYGFTPKSLPAGWTVEISRTWGFPYYKRVSDNYTTFAPPGVPIPKMGVPPPPPCPKPPSPPKVKAPTRNVKAKGAPPVDTN